jgi:5-methylthioadenosine/S-adenosylhomocysteine deaminase
MKNVDLIVQARWIIPLDKSNEYIENAAIAIDKGQIIALGPASTILKNHTANNVLNLENHALLPGFINAHTHSSMSLFRGLADDIPLMQWLNNHMWPAEQKITSEATIKLGSQLAIAEMIRGGTTCFNDHYFFPLKTEEAVIESGIRATLGLVVFDVETLWSSNEAEALEKAEDILKKRHDKHPNIRWALAPHAPYSVSDDTLKKISALSQKFNIPVHIHLHETQDEIDLSIKEYGIRPIQRLKQLNLLNSRLLAVHMVHVNAEDLELINNTGTHIIHSPESNLKLGSGIAPISKLHDSGFNIALGTDGAASNNDLDMMGEMRTASFIAKGSTGDPTTLNAYEALRMATINGAKALGIDHITGSLESGKQADLIAIDLSDYWQQPVLNPAAHMVYSANRLSVSHVWVNGEILMEDKKLTTIDTEQLLKQVHQLTKEIKPFMHHLTN